MSAVRALRQYQNVSVDSASPPRVLDELLGRLLADCHDAAVLLRAGDMAGKGMRVSHALAIVGELVASLDHKAAPALAANLASLWGFVAERLGDGNLGDASAFDDAARVVVTLREAFALAHRAVP